MTSQFQTRFRALGLQGLGFRALGLEGVKAQGLGCRALGLGCLEPRRHSSIQATESPALTGKPVTSRLCIGSLCSG